MDEWYCNVCDEKMQEADIIMVYMEDTEIPGAVGMVCPKCQELYLPESFVIEQVNPGERMLEGK